MIEDVFVKADEVFARLVDGRTVLALQLIETRPEVAGIHKVGVETVVVVGVPLDDPVVVLVEHR